MPVFVLALTSNPEGAAVQQARGADGRTVATALLDAIAAENAGAHPLGAVGAVVGATVGSAGTGGYDLTAVNGPLLAPGIGAQGAGPADLRAVFGTALPAVLPSVSREVLRAGPGPDALRAAAEDLARQLAGVLRVAG